MAGSQKKRTATRREVGDRVTTDITALTYGGRGIGRVEGKVIFVPNTAPGDRVDVAVVEEKEGYIEGIVEEVVTPSPRRAEPFCPLFGQCGGCQWQHIAYSDQVEWKERIFRETLERIGGIAPLPLEKTIPAEMSGAYRTRAQFHVKEGRWGFFSARSNDIVPLEECPLLDPLLNKVFTAIRDVFAEEAPDFPLHTVEVGMSPEDNKAVALLHSGKSGKLDLERLMERVGDLKGVELFITPKRRRGGTKVASAGDCYLSYRVSGLFMRSHLSAFSQVNFGQNERLVETVLDFADPRESDSVVDLFAGAGNLTLPLARRCAEVTAIEQSRVAVEDGRINAKAKDMSTVTFRRADAADGAKSLDKGASDIVVLDPPRGGALRVAREIVEVAPEKIVYLSCNPATLARDLAFLVRHGYNVTRAVTIDMFPHTYHIEGVVKLTHV